MANPKVSVIIPVYNEEKYLRQCLDSVINQTLREIEIICIDDGSTDTSLSILKEYEHKDSRIKVLSQKNKNAGAARNMGLKVSKGEFLSFLDSDDYFEREMLEEAYEVACQTSAEIVVFNARFFDTATGKTENADWFLHKNEIPQNRIFSGHDIAKKIFNYGNNVAWNKLFSHKFINQYQLRFQEIFHTNDTYFVCLAHVYAKRIIYIDKKFVNYRRNVKTSLASSNTRQEHPFDIYDVLKSIQDELKKLKVYENYKQSFVSFALSHLMFNLSCLNGLAYEALKQQILTKWIKEFDIEGHEESYFYAKFNYDKLQQLITKKYEAKIYSSDIFDTLITRKMATPDGIFYLMQELLCTLKQYDSFPSLLKRNFHDIRMAMEQFLCQKIHNHSGDEDTNLNEIYRYISYQYDLSIEQMEALKTLEIDCESAALIPIWKNINLLKKIQQCGNKVVLISDMYHSADTIRAWLIRFDEFFADIPIYVSSEYSQKKWSGSLFRLISEKEHIKFSEWVHYGDNQYTDVDVPKKLGIHAIKYDYSQLKPYEKKAIEKYPGDYQLQRCIGISRALRLTYKSPKLQLGISLGGPVLYPYVRWILDQAIKDHIETLYFIARDGYVLKKIADILIQILGLPIKTKYFYCSRKSLRDPYFNKENQHITEIASYIKQEINFAEKFAFVEYMGTGTTQDCMYKVISEKGLGISGPTYYWYLSEDMMPKSGKMKMMFPLNRRFHTILELLVRAPHGQTIGYRRQGEVVYPVFEEQEGKALVEYDYEEYVKGVCLFSEEAAKIERDFDSRMNRLNQELFYVEYLADFSNMDLETADLLGDIPFQLDGIVKEIATYAPLVRDKAIENLLKGDKHEYKGTNAALSIRRSIGDKMTRDSAVENSISFKVGRAITFIPRKVRGGVACFREHGWKYTFFRTLEHLHLK